MTDLKLPELPEVIAFLLGEGELCGYSYGDRGGGMPAFWWREHLRRAYATAAVVAERAAAEADARRYRFLRDDLRGDGQVMMNGSLRTFCGIDLDAAIDCALEHDDAR